MALHIRKGFRALLDEANGVVSAIAPADAIGWLDGGAPAGPPVLFVDLRDPRECEREGVIPEAYHCPRGMLEFWIDPESPYARTIFQQDRYFVFYCASGWRSALAAKAAQEMGLHPVAHLEGGITAWRAAGGPIAAGFAHKKT